jgi:hypothetical protein
VNNIDYLEEERHVHHSSFNKERFCKRNKLGGGRYGPHIYKDGYCMFCNKTDPQLKRRDYGRIE